MSYPVPQIDVTIGAYTRHYRAWRTEAPVAYDGMGTIGLWESSAGRLVLIQLDHVDWQVGRYSSGMYASHICENCVLDNILSVLWVRLATPTSEDPA